MFMRFPAEPTSAISSLLMCLITIIGPPYKVRNYAEYVPVEFWFAQAGTFLNGIGAFIFHGVHPDDYVGFGVNPRLLDGMALATMSVFTSLLFVSKKDRAFVCPLMVAYIFFVPWSDDSLTYEYLFEHTRGLIAIGIKFPLIAAFYAFSLWKAGTSFERTVTWPTFVVFGAAVLAWVIDRFFCDNVDVLSFFHMHWHVFGTYANLLLMSLGLRYQGFDLKGTWLPIVTMEPACYHKM